MSDIQVFNRITLFFKTFTFIEDFMKLNLGKERLLFKYERYNKKKNDSTYFVYD